MQLEKNVLVDVDTHVKGEVFIGLTTFLRDRLPRSIRIFLDKFRSKNQIYHVENEDESFFNSRNIYFWP